jgi:hypothetical protein
MIGAPHGSLYELDAEPSVEDAAILQSRRC